MPPSPWVSLAPTHPGRDYLVMLYSLFARILELRFWTMSPVARQRRGAAALVD
jgi:hypothetical protein